MPATIFSFVLLALGLTANAGTITQPLYSAYGNSNSCQQIGAVTTCEYDGWSTSGANLLHSDLSIYEWDGISSVSSYTALERQDRSNSYGGGSSYEGNLWGTFWNWSEDSLHSVITGSSTYVDTTGYFFNSQWENDSLTETTYISRGSWNCFVPTQCVSEGNWFQLTTSSFEGSGRWEEYRSGFLTGGDRWSDAFANSWSDSGSWYDIWDSTAYGGGNVPEPATTGMIGLGLLAAGLIRRRN